jgi:hypothetical protein
MLSRFVFSLEVHTAENHFAFFLGQSHFGSNASHGGARRITCRMRMTVVVNLAIKVYVLL